ncbi:MAG: outer membrane beta-barrel domain-containing protein [Archangiaceae bacterium]|nr:outer membrane beta-barrel domain-containing protein [Archangiaceae bacterium]
MKVRASLLLLALVAAPAFAEEEQGALVEKVAVRNRLFTTERRFELGLNLGFMVLTQLTEHYTANLDLAFNIVNTFAIELLAGGSYSRHTSLARDVADQQAAKSVSATTRWNDLSGLWEMVGNAVVALRWQPLYGKIGGALQDLLFGNPIHFQFYVTAGGGAGYFKRDSIVICLHKTSNACDEWLSESKVGPLFTGGLGFRFFLPTYGNHHSLKLEVRDWIYLDSYNLQVKANQVTPSNPTPEAQAASAGVTQLWQVMVGYSYMF